MQGSVDAELRVRPKHGPHDEGDDAGAHIRLADILPRVEAQEAAQQNQFDDPRQRVGNDEEHEERHGRVAEAIEHVAHGQAYQHQRGNLYFEPLDAPGGIDEVVDAAAGDGHAADDDVVERELHRAVGHLPQPQVQQIAQFDEHGEAEQFEEQYREASEFVAEIGVARLVACGVRLYDLRRGSPVEFRGEVCHVGIHRFADGKSAVDRRVEEGVDEQVRARGTRHVGHCGEHVPIIKDKHLAVSLPAAHITQPHGVAPLLAGIEVVDGKRVDRREAVDHGVEAQGIGTVVKREQQDAAKAHKTVGDVERGEKAEALMGAEEALVGAVDDAEAGGGDGNVVDDKGIVHFPGCHVEFVLDVPQPDGFCQEGHDEREGDVQQQADVERGVGIAPGAAHLGVEKPRRGFRQRAADEGEHGQHAAHYGKEPEV